MQPSQYGRFDVAIIGSGIAGSTLATILAKQNISTEPDLLELVNIFAKSHSIADCLCCPCQENHPRNRDGAPNTEQQVNI